MTFGRISVDRLLVVLLVLLCALLAVGRGGSLARSASGTPSETPSGTPSGTPADEDPQTLGPATGLLLRDQKASRGDLTLGSSDGRLSWSKSPFDRVYTVGFVHITKPLRKLRERPSLVEEVEALVEGFAKEEADYRKRLEEVSARLRELQEGSEEYRRIFSEGDALFQEFRAWQAKAVEQRNQLESKHIESSYRQLIDAVDVVAARLGVDIVYRFIPTNDAFEAGDFVQAMNEIRFRSVLRYPQDLDITPEVLKELGFDSD
jgi:Skp family chaperone for outer membrane proteins